MWLVAEIRIIIDLSISVKNKFVQIFVFYFLDLIIM